MELRAYEGGATDTGRARQNNEDSFGWRRPASPDEAARGSLYVVCDGVGGEAAGEAASKLAVETFLREYYSAPGDDPSEALRQAVAAANTAVYRSGADRRATTLVGAAVVGDLLHVVNVGDSRLYLARGGDISQITLDHSWVQEQVRAGRIRSADAQRHPRGNVITRWLGQEKVEGDVFALELEDADRLVLCTDGLFRHVSEDAIRRVAQTLPEEAAAAELVRLANEGGGTDNITVVVVRIAGDDDATLPGPGDAPRAPNPSGLPAAYLIGPLLALVVVVLAAAGLYLVVGGSDTSLALAGSPVALALGPDGAAYVADQAAGTVRVFQPGGLTDPRSKVLGLRPTVASSWSAGEADRPPVALAGLSVAPDGTVFVVDGGGDRIRAFDSRGGLRAAWGERGAAPGQLDGPSGVAVDGSGRVYVADAGNRRVQAFDGAGAFEGAWGGDALDAARLREASGIAVDERGNVFVADAAAGRVVRFDREGRFQDAWSAAAAGAAAQPRGLAVGPSGLLYVADAGLRRVWQLVAPSEPGARWGALWSSGPGFQGPTAVAVDSRGALYVLDPRGGGVHVLQPRDSLWRA